MIFNSVSELQTRKFQLKPDKLNGFDTPKMDMVTGRQKLTSKILREDRWVLVCLCHL